MNFAKAGPFLILSLMSLALYLVRGFNYSKGRWVALRLYSGGGGT